MLKRTLLLAVSAIAVSCTTGSAPQNPPQAIEFVTGPGATALKGPSRPVNQPLAANNVVRWEGENRYFFSKHAVGAGIMADPYAIKIVVNAAFLTSTVSVETGAGAAMQKISAADAPDQAVEQYAVEFEQNPANPANPYYYIAISPDSWPAGTIEHGGALSYKIVSTNAAGRTEKTLDLVYIEPGRCRLNAVTASPASVEAPGSASVSWSADGCKAAAATKTSGTIAVGGTATNVITGTPLFAKVDPSHDASFGSSHSLSNLTSTTTVRVTALDAMWRSDSDSAKVTVTQPPSGPPPSVCPGGGGFQNYSYCVSCSLGSYDFPSYDACSKADAETELRNSFGGCTIKEKSTATEACN